jgi:hypothetical protein
LIKISQTSTDNESRTEISIRIHERGKEASEEALLLELFRIDEMPVDGDDAKRCRGI